MCLRLGLQPVALLRDIRNFGKEARQEKSIYQVILLQVYGILAALFPTIYCPPLDEQQASWHYMLCF